MAITAYALPMDPSLFVARLRIVSDQGPQFEATKRAAAVAMAAFHENNLVLIAPVVFPWLPTLLGEPITWTPTILFAVLLAIGRRRSLTLVDGDLTGHFVVRWFSLLSATPWIEWTELAAARQIEPGLASPTPSAPPLALAYDAHATSASADTALVTYAAARPAGRPDAAASVGSAESTIPTLDLDSDPMRVDDSVLAAVRYDRQMAGIRRADAARDAAHAAVADLAPAAIDAAATIAAHRVAGEVAAGLPAYVASTANVSALAASARETDRLRREIARDAPAAMAGSAAGAAAAATDKLRAELRESFPDAFQQHAAAAIATMAPALAQARREAADANSRATGAESALAAVLKRLESLEQRAATAPTGLSQPLPRAPPAGAATGLTFGETAAAQRGTPRRRATLAGGGSDSDPTSSRRPRRGAGKPKTPSTSNSDDDSGGWGTASATEKRSRRRSRRAASASDTSSDGSRGARDRTAGSARLPPGVGSADLRLDDPQLWLHAPRVWRRVLQAYPGSSAEARIEFRAAFLRDIIEPLPAGREREIARDIWVDVRDAVRGRLRSSATARLRRTVLRYAVPRCFGAAAARPILADLTMRSKVPLDVFRAAALALRRPGAADTLSGNMGNDEPGPEETALAGLSRSVAAASRAGLPAKPKPAVGVKVGTAAAAVSAHGQKPLTTAARAKLRKSLDDAGRALAALPSA